jgi:hypothetical protein
VNVARNFPDPNAKYMFFLRKDTDMPSMLSKVETQPCFSGMEDSFSSR